MRAVCTVLLLAVLSTAGTGCAVFGKKEGSAERSHGLGWFKKKDSAANPPPPKFPTDPLAPSGASVPLPPGPAAQAPSAPEALLAGRVVDDYNRPANNTYVQLVQLDAGKDGLAPVDVATSADGYFIIQGLKSGSQYKLIARTKQGDRLLAGITIREAPDPHVVIQVSEKFATSTIPPLPTNQEKDVKPAASSGLDGKAPPVAAWAPTPPGSGAPSSGPSDLPAKLTVPTPTPAATTPNALAPAVASTPNTNWPPALQIAPKKPAPMSVTPQPPPLPTANDLQSKLAPLVPSAVILGSDLQILALKDLDDQTWNFHKDRKGRVVLLDFWTRDCLYCQQMMPILTQMQSKFGPQGLEVLGVFLDSGPTREQAQRAKKLCYNLQTNYRQVLGQDDKTRLREQFNLQGYPTIILLDDRGHVLWRHTGVPDQAVLEQVLQKHLANRAF